MTLSMRSLDWSRSCCMTSFGGRRGASHAVAPASQTDRSLEDSGRLQSTFQPHQCSSERRSRFEALVREACRTVGAMATVPAQEAVARNIKITATLTLSTL